MEEFFKNLYKNKGADFGSLTQTSKRSEQLKEHRRETRNNLLSQRRKISTLQPLTPEPVSKNPSKRLLMLAKWKQEREERKKLEKQKAKPLFKVCHVPVTIGLPDLDNVNHVIKGKAIKKSKFAPTGYEFVAPANLKPVDLKQIKPKNKSEAAVSRMKELKSLVHTKNTRSQKHIASPISTSTATKTRKQKAVPGQQAVQTTSKKLRYDASKAFSSTKGKEVKENARALNFGSQKPLPQFTSKVTRNATDNHPSTSNSKLQSEPKKELPKQNAKTAKTVQIQKSDYCNRRRNRTMKIRKTPAKLKHQAMEHCDIDQSFKEDCIIISDSDAMSVDSNKERTRGRKRKSSNKRKSRSSDCYIVLEEVETSRNQTILAPALSSTSDNEDLNVRKDSTEHREPYSVNVLPEKDPVETVHALNVAETDQPLEETDLHETRKRPRLTRQKKISRASSAFTDLTAEAQPSDTASGADAHLDETMVMQSPSENTKTPEDRRIRGTSPAYLSPFVTVARGKDSARKEYKYRQSSGGMLPEDTQTKVSPAHTSPKAGAAYFTKVVDLEKARIEQMCREWEKYKEETQPCEGACDMINTAIGQSNLLLTKKFQQFRSLIARCQSQEETGEGQKILCEDLHGFWDVIYMQVEDLDKRFANLARMRDNDWEEIMEEKKKPEPKKRGRPKRAAAVAATSSLREAIKAARMKNKKNANDEAVTTNEKHSEVNTFNGGFVALPSPAHSAQTPSRRSARQSARKSLLTQVLSDKAHRRTSAKVRSPGLTMLTVTQRAKVSEGVTPAKSILKINGSKSTGRLNKSVLFSESVKIKEDSGTRGKHNENDQNTSNLIVFSPDGIHPAIQRTSQRMKLTRSKLF